MDVRSDLPDSVVPDSQHTAQPVARPHALPHLDLFDRDLATLRPDQRAFPDTAVTAGAQPLGVFILMRTEQFRLAPVRPADDRAALDCDHACVGAVDAQAGGAGEAGRSSVTQGGGDDRHPMGRVAGEAGRPLDVVSHVLGARVRLARSTAGVQHPAAPVARRRDLVGQRDPLTHGHADAQRLGRPARYLRPVPAHGISVPRPGR